MFVVTGGNLHFNLILKMFLVFLNEDGRGNIYDKSGIEAMDIIDEESNRFAIKQLADLNIYLGKRPTPTAVDYFNERDEEIEDPSVQKGCLSLQPI